MKAERAAVPDSEEPGTAGCAESESDAPAPVTGEKGFGEKTRHNVIHDLLFAVPVLLLLVSSFLPYWHVVLHAPQYPSGLRVTIYLNSRGMVGDIEEINGLNHYIGMLPLDQGAQLERRVAPYGLFVLSAMSGVALLWRRRMAVLFALPTAGFPIFFVADLQYWLWYFGHHLDPTAPLSSAIKPFTPPVLGRGTVGQFKVVATFGSGLWLAILGSILTILAIVARWRATTPKT